MKTAVDLATMIAEEPDQKLREVLAVIAELFGRLESKLDSAFEDAHALRKLVLNGHADTFHEDMAWVRQRREAKCEEVCEYMAAKMADERLAEEEASRLAKVESAEQVKTKYDIRRQIVGGILMMLIGGAIGKLVSLALGGG